MGILIFWNTLASEVFLLRSEDGISSRCCGLPTQRSLRSLLSSLNSDTPPQNITRRDEPIPRHRGYI